MLPGTCVLPSQMFAKAGVNFWNVLLFQNSMQILIVPPFQKKMKLQHVLFLMNFRQIIIHTLSIKLLDNPEFPIYPTFLKIPNYFFSNNIKIEDLRFAVSPEFPENLVLVLLFPKQLSAVKVPYEG